MELPVRLDWLSPISGGCSGFRRIANRQFAMLLSVQALRRISVVLLLLASSYGASGSTRMIVPPC